VYGGPQPPRSSTHAHYEEFQHYLPSHCRKPFPNYLAHDEDVSSSALKGSGAAATVAFPGQRDTAADTNSPSRRSTSPRAYGRGPQHSNYHRNNECPPDEGPRRAPSSSSCFPSINTLRTDTPAPQPQQSSPSHAKALTEQSSQALFEVTLPVSTKLPSQEAQCRPLGVYVRTGRGGANGVTRLLLVRLTDPADPFFLYELELLEDDYGAFKQRLELLVDFQGFPRYLVNVLRDVADGTSPYELSFVLHTAAADGNRGTLRVLETTEFKTVEHISLLLLRQGDAGLKRYLAERFQFFEQSYRSTEAARAAVTAELQERVDQLQRAKDELRDTLRKREEEMRFMTTDAEKEQLAALNRLRDQHTKEMTALRESYEKKLETHSRALEEKTQQLRDVTAEKDAALSQLRARVTELEANTASLESQLRRAQDTGTLQAKELETLREINDELANFKAEATKAMTENELNYVTLTERLRGTSTALQNREERVVALQEHYEKQDEYIRILAEQNRQLADRVRETEQNLEKAHHIIANQLQTIKSGKDRYHIAADQLRSQEALLQEKENTQRRQQDEINTAHERIQELQRKNSDLRDQLEKTNNARELLVQEVRQTQQALLRLQQSTSVNGRHWGVLSGGGSGASTAGNYRASSISAGVGTAGLSVEERYGTTSRVPADLMREFSANASVGRQLGYHSASSGGVGGVTSVHSAIGGTLPNVSPSTALYAGYTAGSASLRQAAPTAPSLFRTQSVPQASSSPSPSPAFSSQERAGSSETGGLTEPHGRGSTSSLGKTEPSTASSTNNNHNSVQNAAAAAAVSRHAHPLVGSVSLDKPVPVSSPLAQSIGKPIHNNNAARSPLSELAVKSFFNNDATQSLVAAEGGVQSAYF
jgi:spindle assembly abnormal protein 6